MSLWTECGRSGDSRTMTSDSKFLFELVGSARSLTCAVCLCGPRSCRRSYVFVDCVCTERGEQLP